MRLPSIAARKPLSTEVAMEEAHTSQKIVHAYLPSKWRGLGKVIGALVATLVVVSLLLVHVWSRYRVVKLGYELSELSSEREQLLEENKKLRLELRILTRSDRLEPIAKTQLGLITPRPEQLLYVRTSQLPLPEFPALSQPAKNNRGPAQASLTKAGGQND